ncbi:metal-dependent transcriptional regulator [Enorma massiliensis]|uniref:metal-dependent transcriptional regulator n=1 Tax=Coriobacteriia TaxID=84998 RepID=UPI003AEFD484
MISADSSLDPADVERDSISHTKTMTTESSEDYLEAIFVIRAERGSCRNVDIAEYLGITKPSVTKALSGLSSQSLVEVVDRDVRLTQRGLGIAKATLEKHEFFRRLLRDAGVDDEVASKEACRMEHCLSADSFEKFSAYLKPR